MTEKQTGESTSFGWLLFKRALWFGVGFGAGLAPFLGNKNVPGFSALIRMYPYEMDWIIPVSGLLMGMIALVMEYAYEKIDYKRKVVQKRVDRWFLRTIGVFVVSFVALIFIYTFTVTRIRTPQGTLAMVTGVRKVPHQPPGSQCKCAETDPHCNCVEGAPSEACLGDSVNPANVRRCFDTTRIDLATIALAFIYFSLTGSLVASVGLLIIIQIKNQRTPATIPP